MNRSPHNLLRRFFEAAVDAQRLARESAALMEANRTLRIDNIQLLRDIVAAGRQFCDLIESQAVSREITQEAGGAEMRRSSDERAPF